MDESKSKGQVSFFYFYFLVHMSEWVVPNSVILKYMTGKQSGIIMGGSTLVQIEELEVVKKK